MHIDEADVQSETTFEEPLDRGGKLLIAVLVVAAFVMILNETIMSVALPRLMIDLNVTASTAQWLTTGYLLTMAIVIPVTGYLFQRFRLRQVFISAMSLFSVGTLLAAAAPGFEVLLAGRVLQAGGTAILLPLLFTTVLRVVPSNNRGRMMGVISIVIAVAPAIGPTISGVILNALNWRWMFWIVLPVGLIAFGLGAVLVKNSPVRGGVTFDAISVLLSVLAFGGTVYGLGSLGHSPEVVGISVWIPTLVGLVALTAFVRRQVYRQREGRAFLDLRPFSRSNFTIGLTVLAICMMALFGSLILLPMYLQNVRGLDTLKTGLMLLPGGLTMGVLSPFVGRAFDKYGARLLVIPGTVLISAALWAMASLNSTSDLPLVVVIHCMLMGGLATVMTPLMTSSLGSLPEDLHSHGSAILNTAQQLAGAAGTALFVTVMSTIAASGLAGGDSQLEAAMSGIHMAFIGGGAISFFAVGMSFFIASRRTGKRSVSNPRL